MKTSPLPIQPKTSRRTATDRSESELGRIKRALGLLSAANQAMRSAVCQIELLEALCRIIIDAGGYRFAWIGYAENDEKKTVTPVAQDGFDGGVLSGLFISWDETTPNGQGTAGTTLRSGQPCIVRSCATDPRMSAWREPLLSSRQPPT